MRGLPAWMLRKRSVPKNRYEELMDIMRDLSETKNLRICDEPRPGLSYIERGMAVNKDVDVVIVDYLTRCAMPKADRHDLAVTEFVSGLKNIARRHDCHVVACSQLNRRVDSEKNERKPILSDLRDSGGIEQEADSVWLLSADAPGSDLYTLNVAKNRHGFMGGMTLEFDRNHLKFKERTKDVYTD